jgi:aspartate racemase
MKKKKIGIVGGMGSRAGIFLLKRIIDHSPAETDQDFPEIIFHNNSSIPDRTIAIVYKERSPLPDILKSINLFNENRVEIIALACITSYYYYNQIIAHTRAEVLNPLQLVSECIMERYPGVRKIGVLATTGTINTGLFHKELEGTGAEIVTLDHHDQEQVFMQSVYMKNGFKSAVISEEARELMREAVEKLKKRKVDVIVGGCTEVSIAVDPASVAMPYIDTVDLLARKMVDSYYDINVTHI